MQIDLDFIDDIAAGRRAELVELGYVVPPPTGTPLQAAHKICVQHWNAYARRIPVRPRTARLSTELRRNEPLLPEPIRSGLAVVIKEIEAGLDLTARLSRRLPKLQYNDGMLNDWGLHHLHLHDTERAKGTSHVLILMVKGDDAFLIDVREHDHWADQDLVEILHSNWPRAIEKHRQLKAIDLTYEVTDDQRRHLRAKSGNAPIQTKDGTIYMAIGGGMAGSGDNIRAVMWGDWLLGLAQVVQDFFNEQREWLAELINRNVSSPPQRIRVHLVSLTKDVATVEFEHEGKNYRYLQPIDDPPRTVIDLTNDLSSDAGDR